MADIDIIKELRKEFGEQLANKIIILITLGYSVDDAIQTALER